MHKPIIQSLARFALPISNALLLDHITGAEHLPVGTPYIFACNHVGFPDAWLLGNTFLQYDPRPAWILARNDFWIGTRWTRFIGPKIGALFIDWRNPAESLDQAQTLVEQGHIVGFFPEGARNYTSGILLKGKTGMIRLALATGAPIVPIGYSGPSISTMRDYVREFVIRGKRGSITVGKPMDFSWYQNKPITRELLYTLTDEVMVEIARLSGRRPILHA